MIDYTIAAHPTTYRGLRFRSRLEARWAAFFDLLNWRWEYEPFDLKGWVPDFILVGDRGDALVEIKPIVRPDYDTVRRITHAASERAETLILGGSSFFAYPHYAADLYSYCNCSDVSRCVWQGRAIGLIESRYDIVIGHNGNYTGMLNDILDVNSVQPFMGMEIMCAWNSAGNKTRWHINDT